MKLLKDMSKEERLKLSNFEDEILELIDDQDDMTRGDLQGAVSVIVWKIYNKIQER